MIVDYITGTYSEVRLIFNLVAVLRRAWPARYSRDRKYPVASMPLQLEDL